MNEFKISLYTHTTSSLIPKNMLGSFIEDSIVHMYQCECIVNGFVRWDRPKLICDLNGANGIQNGWKDIMKQATSCQIVKCVTIRQPRPNLRYCRDLLLPYTKSKVDSSVWGGICYTEINTVQQRSSSTVKIWVIYIDNTWMESCALGPPYIRFFFKLAFYCIYAAVKCKYCRPGLLNALDSTITIQVAAGWC